MNEKEMVNTVVLYDEVDFGSKGGASTEELADLMAVFSAIITSGVDGARPATNRLEVEKISF